MALELTHQQIVTLLPLAGYDSGKQKVLRQGIIALLAFNINSFRIFKAVQRLERFGSG